MRSGLMILILALVSSSLWTQKTFAQNESDNEELNIIELELEPSAPKIEPQRKSEMPAAPENLSDFSGLGKLAPFSEVSVLQKRYFPKTGRFQAFGGLGVITNDAFFNTVGATVKLGYFFTESMGLELSYMHLSTSEAKSTEELKKIQGVTTENIVYAKSYTGLDFMWVPIYGKFSYFDQKIINFDMYLSVGGGSTKIQNDESAGTFHIGTGQLFALSKSMAFRWDFSWNFYSAKGIDESTNTINNLYVTVGASFFFPEASYR